MLLRSPFFWEDHLHLHIKDSSGFYTKEPRSKYNPVLLQSTCPYTPSSMCLFINPSQPGFLSRILEIANFLIGFHVHGNFLSIILPDSERKADIKNTNHAIKTKEVSRFPKKHVPCINDTATWWERGHFGSWECGLRTLEFWLKSSSHSVFLQNFRDF